MSKTHYRTKAEERTDFIKKFGEDAFNQVSRVDDKWKKLKELPIPDGFAWLWGVFLQIWKMCERDFNGNIIFTARSVLDYEQCFGVTLSISDRQYLFKMKDWACETVYELKNSKK